MTTIKFSSSLTVDPDDLLQQAVQISDGDTDEETGTENMFLSLIFLDNRLFQGCIKKGGYEDYKPPTPRLYNSCIRPDHHKRPFFPQKFELF